MQFIENQTFDELSIGDSAELTRKLTPQDIALFAAMSGDVNPAHGMWGGALVSAVLGTELPGPGTIYLSQSMSFLRPVGLGDILTVRVTVADKKAAHHHVTFDCLCLNQSGEVVTKGQALIIAPTEKLRRPRVVLPEIQLHERAARFQDLINATKPLSAVPTAVVHPLRRAFAWRRA
tara:strand:+ start:7481 stop:8011 length:531 start_codon:yes stop_codon:yes gene_type:complete